MTRITVKLTAREIELLCNLAADELFRREFIDLRLPGFNSNPAELSFAKKLVERLRVSASRASGMPAPMRHATAVSRTS